jgi:hypothetical protein
VIPSAPAASSSRAPAPVRARVPTGSRVASSNTSNAAAAQIQQLHHALAEAEVQAEGFEKERDFYFESESYVYLMWVGADYQN